MVVVQKPEADTRSRKRIGSLGMLAVFRLTDGGLFYVKINSPHSGYVDYVQVVGGGVGNLYRLPDHTFVCDEHEAVLTIGGAIAG